MSISEPPDVRADLLATTVTSDVEIAGQRRGPAPTGEVLNRGGSFAVCLGRSFTVDPSVVWAWLTEPERMRIWLGDSRLSTAGALAGQRLFHLAGDALDAPLLDYAVELVRPTSRIRVCLREAAGEGEDSSTSWRIDASLTETPTGCHLLLEQTISDRVAAPSVAASCEFYLDRLVRACHDRPFSHLDYDDYFLAQGAAYRRMFPLPRARDDELG